MIRVLLVDDQQLVRAGLRMLCESDPGIDVVAEADNGRDAVRLAEELRPDVVMMDLRMPGMDGTSATARIHATLPTCRIVVVTTFDDDDHLYPALAAGACGFLVKDATPDELLDGIRRAARDENPFSPTVLRRLVTQAMSARTDVRPPADDLTAPLTARERDVLRLLGSGLSNADIGERLHLGVTTVKTHVGNLMNKTGHGNRVQLAVFAVRAGLAEEP
jgi:DNA-binding NarL/FixJ family response regulator